MVRQGRSFWDLGGRIGLIVMLVMLSVGFTPAQAAPRATVVIKPSAMNNWGFLEESITGTGSFVNGPATAPLGNGSVRMVTNSTGRLMLGTVQYANTLLSAITTLKYSTYRASPTTGAVLPAINIDIDYDLTDGTTTWQGRLIYEPYLLGTPATAIWQEWDALAGKWWASGAPGTSLCPQSTPCTWAQVKANWPNAGVRVMQGGVAFKIGAWAFDGNVDAFTIGINGTDTTYDFEPETQCTTLCYVNGATGNDAFGGDTPTTAKKTIQAALNQVVAGGTVMVAAGTYNENLTIAKNNITLQGAGATTIIKNASPAVATTAAIGLNNGVTGTTIKDLRVEGFTSPAIYGVAGNNHTIVNRIESSNNKVVGSLGSIYFNGPVNGITVTNSLVEGGGSRGIVIWNGLKSNIYIANNIVRGNNCCGIELQDGRATGVTIKDNVVENNADSGIAAIGLEGPGANLIANNKVTNNGRFGIEIKLPNGSGLASGPGSIVVSGNVVSRTLPLGSEVRDAAGISVYRRGYVAGNGNVDIPTGVVVENNTVIGYQQPSNSDGFGIVVEGTNMTVRNNTLTNNDVGLQLQQGHLPYTPYTAVDGDQTNLADQYFGRGNSPVVCATVGTNTFSGNGVDYRKVGTANGEPNTTNVNTGERFCGIQTAINDSDTLNGHTIRLDPVAFQENIVISKSITLEGTDRAQSIMYSAISGPLCSSGSICAGSSNIILVQANNVTIQNLTVDGDNPNLTSNVVRSGADIDARTGIMTNHSKGVYQNLVVQNTTIKNIYLRALYASSGGSFNFNHNSVSNVNGDVNSIAIFNFSGSGVMSDNTVNDANDAIASNWSKGVDMLNNTVTNASSGVHTDNAGSNDSVDHLVNNTVSSCKPDGYGVWVFAPFSAVTMTDNKVTDCTVGLTVAGQNGTNNPNVLVANNEVSSDPMTDTLGLYITTSRFGWDSTDINVTARNNLLSDVNLGVYIETEANYTATVVITANALINTPGAAMQVIETGTANVDARLNWWDSPTGPMTDSNPLGVGGKLLGNALYSPWLCNGTDTSTARGFQPDLSNQCMAAEALVFVIQPVDGTVNQALAPIVVEVRDANGNLVTSYNGPVTLSLGNNPSGATLSGTLTVNAVNGVATFSDLVINQVGIGYTLIATAENLTPATSEPFDIGYPKIYLPLVMKN